MKKIIFIFLLFLPFMIRAEKVNLEWEKGLIIGNELLITKNNEIVVWGIYYSGSSDLMWEIEIVKYDQNGKLLFKKNYSGNGYDQIYDLKETKDGNILFSAHVTPGKIDDIEFKESNNIIMEIDKDGKILWYKTINEINGFSKINLLSDDSFIVSGWTNSNDIEGIENKGGYDVIISRYDKDGNQIWIKNWGGSKDDSIGDLMITKNNEIILFMTGYSKDIQGLNIDGYSDIVFVKNDKDGNLLWQKSWGGNNSEFFRNVFDVLENDDIIIEVSSSSEYVGSIKNEKGNFFIKIDTNGNVKHSTQVEIFYNIYFGPFSKRLENDDYIFAGYNDDNAFVLKSDSKGNVLWKKTYAESEEYEYISDLEITTNGDILVSINECEFDQGMDYTTGIEKAMLIKYDKNGNEMWRTIWDGDDTDNFDSVALIDNSIYIVAYTASSDKKEDNKSYKLIKYSIIYDMENVTTNNGTTEISQQGNLGVINTQPNKGFEVDEIVIKDKEGNVLDVEITKQEDGTYSFELYTDVSVEVIYKESIDNPKTGILDVMTILFIGFIMSVTGIFIVKNYNERLEF